jgi:DNA-binding protein HU-beta
MSKSKSDEVIKAIFGGITQTLQSKDSVQFIEFGRFSVTETKARNGRNPRTGETIQIPAGKRVKFTSGKSLKQAVNA